MVSFRENSFTNNYTVADVKTSADASVETVVFSAVFMQQDTTHY